MPRLSTEERKEQIINEAIKIIHGEGYSALSIRELSGRVGISEPAIYRHFENKEAIILGILDKMKNLGIYIEEKLHSIPDAKERIIHFVLFHYEFLGKKPEMTSVLFSDEIFDHNPVLENKFNEVIGQRWNILTGLIDDLKAGGVGIDQDTEDLSLILLGLLRITVLQWKRSGFNYSLKERGKRVIDTLLQTGFLSPSSTA
jgi:AcrR family transcriptional regulator